MRKGTVMKKYYVMPEMLMKDFLLKDVIAGSQDAIDLPVDDEFPDS